MCVSGSPAEFACAALRKLGVEVEHDPGELEAVPRRGRLIFVANHPFCALDGLIAIALLGKLRPDLKVIASEDLCTMRDLAPMLLPIQVMGRSRARRNSSAMRRAIRWLEYEGALLMFPAGEVSHFDARARCVTDAPWSRAVALLARRVRATVVPMHFRGSRGLSSRVAGFIHPSLRTRMLPRELRRNAVSRVPLRVGAPLAYERLRSFDSDEALTAHLRVTTYLLDSGAAARTAVATPPARSHPLALAGAAHDSAAELARLPDECLLHENGDNLVYCAPAAAISNVLDEIGRLREATLRAAGEGTGRARDIDEFDSHYEHLFAWNRSSGQVLGACRLGGVDQIRNKAGRRGLYSASLFRFRNPFFRLSGPAVELSRWWVRVEQQENVALPMLMWKGIGAWLARHPRYRRLLGPVSLGGHYCELSRQLLVEYLQSHCSDPLLGALVRATHPLKRQPLARTVAAEVAMLGHIDALAPLIEDLESGRRSVPPLLRQYLQLGGRLLESCVNPAAGDSIDCLLMVDLVKSDTRVLARYLPSIVPRQIASAADQGSPLRLAR